MLVVSSGSVRADGKQKRGAGAALPLAQARAAIEQLFATEAPEPEPPPGLLAPAETKRHRRAAARYEKALASWRQARVAHDQELVAACTAYLARDPKHRRILEIRGMVRFRRGRLKTARADLEVALPAGRALLVECCRLLGDYSAALRHAGDDASPDLLEEAGKLKAAIRAAKRAGLTAKVADWGHIGKRCPGQIQPPAQRYELLIAVGGGATLSAGVKEGLERDFGKKIGFGLVIARKPVIYLLDGDGKVLAVNPRRLSWTHRLRRFFGKRQRGFLR